MKRIALIMAFVMLAGCAGLKSNLDTTGAQSGVSDKTTGDRLTGAEFTAVKNTADTADALATVNQGKLAIIEAINGIVKCDGAGTCTVATAGTDYLTPTGDGSGLTGVDAATGDSATSFFDAGTIEHERGGVEADISAYNGIIRISGGVTSNLTLPILPIWGGTGANTSAMNGIPLMTTGTVSVATPGTNYAGITVTTTDPDPTTDDVTLYNNGQIWVNTTDERTWTLYDNTDGAAVWHMYGQNPVIANGSISGNTQFEPGKTHTLTVGADFTLSVNWSANAGVQIITFIITGNATNSITWPTTLWSLSTAPTQPFAASPQIVQLMYVGGTVYGFEVGSDMATP